MIKVIEAKGDTIDAAIQNALASLGCDRDEVSVEVVRKPKSGFLGFGREPAVVKVTYQASPAGKARDFLEGLLIRFGTPAHIEVTEDENEKTIHLELSGENMGAIIGRRGDTLDAFQYLTSIVTNKDEEDRWRVTVDTENYRAKREAALVALANKTAQKALKYKKGVALEPMNPHERRIIHSALQDVEGVTTYSTGSEPNRKVIVAPVDLPQSRGPKKPAGKGGQKPSGGRRRGPKKPPAQGTSIEISNE
ncbi:MAG: RNA-binding cell elongation regulator Jag/EloR [Butyricicoccaceae bacterium]